MKKQISTVTNSFSRETQTWLHCSTCPSPTDLNHHTTMALSVADNLCCCPGYQTTTAPASAFPLITQHASRTRAKWPPLSPSPPLQCLSTCTLVLLPWTVAVSVISLVVTFVSLLPAAPRASDRMRKDRGLCWTLILGHRCRHLTCSDTNHTCHLSRLSCPFYVQHDHLLRWKKKRFYCLMSQHVNHTINN